MAERTLIVMKPDSVGRSIVGEIITRFERVGFHIVGMKMMRPDKEFYHFHYEGIGKMISRRGEIAFNRQLNAMMRMPVIAMVLEGVDAVEVARKLVGTTESKMAAPGTIRGDYSHMSFDYADQQDIGLPNLVHASGSIEDAEAEIKHRFKKEELCDYEPLHKLFTR